MRTITLKPTDFFEFKKLAKFFFDVHVKEGFVHVTADSDALEALGY